MDPPPIVATRDNKDYIRVLLYSDYPTIAGWGLLLRFRIQDVGWSAKGIHSS